VLATPPQAVKTAPAETTAETDEMRAMNSRRLGEGSVIKISLKKKFKQRK